MKHSIRQGDIVSVTDHAAEKVRDGCIVQSVKNGVAQVYVPRYETVMTFSTTSGKTKNSRFSITQVNRK